MGFEVHCRFPLDGERDWEVIDAAVRRVAMCRSDRSGTDGRWREHVWLIGYFGDAVRLKDRLNSIESVEATVRERLTEI